MSNILNNGGTNDLGPDAIDTDATIDPAVPKEPTPHQVQLGVPTPTREPEGGVGTGMNPP